jgi:hypothetical protein
VAGRLAQQGKTMIEFIQGRHHPESFAMRKFSTSLAIVLTTMFAVASQPALAKNSGSSTHHAVKGEHIKEGTITVRKKSPTKPKLNEITVTKPVDKASPK